MDTFGYTVFASILTVSCIMAVALHRFGARGLVVTCSVVTILTVTALWMDHARVSGTIFAYDEPLWATTVPAILAVWGQALAVHSAWRRAKRVIYQIVVGIAAGATALLITAFLTYLLQVFFA